MRLYDIYYKRNGEFLGSYEATSPQSAAKKCLSKYSVKLLYPHDIAAAVRLCFIVVMHNGDFYGRGRK
jgi:hypothetical protein